MTDVVGIEECIEKVWALLVKEEELAAKPEATARLRQLMTSPEFIAMLKTKAGDTWSVWAGAWIGLNLNAGERSELAGDIRMPDGTVVKAPTDIRNEGAPVDAPGCVRLSIESVLEGDQVKKALGEFLGEIAAATGYASMEDAIGSLRIDTRIVVVTDPKTLKPRSARSESVVGIKVKGQTNLRRVDRREFTFDWSIGK
ncbi:MAG: hypothetical protein AB1486_33710 [Planctomycetota bacterium]